jgi:hypothetical protein
MTADDLLREAIAAEVEEVHPCTEDEHGLELMRIQRLVETLYWLRANELDS